MKKFNCTICNVEFETPTRGIAKYCPACKKKVASLATMKSRKKRIPSTVIGCGSGNHNTQNKKNSHYWNVKPDPGRCERCGNLIQDINSKKEIIEVLESFYNPRMAEK